MGKSLLNAVPLVVNAEEVSFKTGMSSTLARREAVGRRFKAFLIFSSRILDKKLKLSPPVP
ncbi:MAG: hypothetical protein ACYT04_69270 [Nostoc sp.]